ncbi:Bifunctional lysine-specific demethylase and histidyl-hydroxylase NO66 [Dirofilaria immitis]
MKKRKNSSRKQQNCANVLNSSGVRKLDKPNDDHSTDSMDELSAYEVLLFKKSVSNDIKSNSNEDIMMTNSSDKTEDGEACKSLMERDRNILASTSPSKSAGKSDEEMGKMNDAEKKERELTRKKTQKGSKRKRKSLGKGELNGSSKMRKQIHSNNVFSSLFMKYDSLEKVQDLPRQNMCDKTLQNSEKKRKRKMQKKVQKIVLSDRIVDYTDEERKINKDKVLAIFDSKNEKFFEADEENKSVKNGKENEKGFQLYDEENREEIVTDSICEEFVKCDGTKESENGHGPIIDFEQKPFSAHYDSVQNGLHAIQWLIDPYDITRFFRAVFQKKIFHICRNNPSYYGNLFSTTKFIDILRTNYIEYGTNVNIAVYKNQQRSTLNGSGKVYPQEIQKSIKAGCSIQFTNPQSFCDNVWYYCDLLQEVFGCFVGANTYITPANTSGFAPHWDDIDAFLLQLEGRKHWKIYAPINDSEMLPRLPSDNFTDDDVADRRPIFDDWLEQGDLLYIPRGFIHKGFADKNVHSLHLTISVCRNVTYADLLERVIPPALSNFAEQHINIRKSLPAGYLDMMGVLECDYPLFKTGALKLDRFIDAIFANFCNYIKGLIESAVDMMAREFMRTALPPMLTNEEKDMTALRVVGSSLFDDKQHIFTKNIPIKLLRRHGQRLIYESEEHCFIVHRMANSRVYEGRPEVLFDLDVKLAGGFANLMDIYPRWCLVSDLKCDTVDDSIRLAELLYSNGLLMAKFSEAME